MVQKQRLPITFFERFYDVVNVVVPEFFKSAVPDLEKMKKVQDYLATDDKAKLRQRLSNKPNSYIKAVGEMHLMFRDLYAQRMDATTHARDTVKDILSRMHKLETDSEMLQLEATGEELDFINDELYKHGIWLKTKDENRPTMVTLVTEENMYVYDDLLDRIFWTMHRFNARGKKVFRFEEQVMHELFLTDTGKVHTSFLQLPYPAVCFHLPFNNKLTIRGDIIEWIYITERVIVGIDEVSGSNTTRRLEFVFISKEDYLWNYYLDIFDTDIENLYMHKSQNMAKYKNSKLAQKEMSDINKFITAAILYMNSKDVVYKDVFANVFAKKQDSRFPVCSIGYGIKVNKDLHYYKPSGDKAETDRHMQVLKWTVRGHFRHYTSDRYEKKVIWIRPYLKGRERDNTEQKEKPTHYDVG